MQFKRIIAGLFCLIGSNVLHADYDVSDLKKLFTDERQRAQIDAARSGNFSGIDSGIQQTNKVILDGYVTRSDGKSVVWLNNKNTLDSSKIGGIKVHQSSIGNNKKVTVSINGKTTRLKPGETWSEDTGMIKDNY